jgi:hypothetical protein
MPVHDWTRVDAGIFHAFHHSWIEEIARALNRGLLPPDYYALAEQHAAGFGPDVLTLQETEGLAEEASPGRRSSGAITLTAPKLQPTAETDMAFYRRKQSTVVVRHVSGDRIVAMVEVVSPGNKATRHALNAFVTKAAEMLEKQVHLLILDLHPPGRRDPLGLHARIWEEIAGEEYTASADKPLTFASYEASLTVRAYVLHRQVGEALPEMPLFLEPEKAIQLPLEATYQAAFAAVPSRWQKVLEKSAV